MAPGIKPGANPRNYAKSLKSFIAPSISLPMRCLALIAATGCHPVGGSTEPAARTPANAMASVVRIEGPGAIGSGVAFSDKVVLTAYHVVEHGVTKVETHAGAECTYVTALAFPDDDLAFLFVEGCRLKPATLAQESPELGDRVYGLGHPLGLTWSLTGGLVSHAHRTLDGDPTTLIQTDAALNPGMSGGPLVDSDGDMVGVNVALLTRDGLFAGVAFAVHIDIVRRNARLAGLL